MYLVSTGLVHRAYRPHSRPAAQSRAIVARACIGVEAGEIYSTVRDRDGSMWLSLMLIPSAEGTHKPQAPAAPGYVIPSWHLTVRPDAGAASASGQGRCCIVRTHAYTRKRAQGRRDRVGISTSCSGVRETEAVFGLGVVQCQRPPGAYGQRALEGSRVLSDDLLTAGTNPARN